MSSVSIGRRNGEVAQSLRALAATPKDPGSMWSCYVETSVFNIHPHGKWRDRKIRENKSTGDEYKLSIQR